MGELIDIILSHPFTDIKIFLSLWGAIGVLIFFWGFIGFFLSHNHIDHQAHARAYMVWGIMLTGTAILVWEGIRWLASLF